MLLLSRSIWSELRRFPLGNPATLKQNPVPPMKSFTMPWRSCRNLGWNEVGEIKGGKNARASGIMKLHLNYLFGGGIKQAANVSEKFWWEISLTIVLLVWVGVLHHDPWKLEGSRKMWPTLVSYILLFAVVINFPNSHKANRWKSPEALWLKKYLVLNLLLSRNGNEFGKLDGKASCKLVLQTVYDPSWNSIGTCCTYFGSSSPRVCFSAVTT